MPPVARSYFELATLLQFRAIETHFQPIISVRKRGAIAYEALSRGINYSTRELIPPQTLFALAEEAGQTVLLDRLCREKALENFSRLFRDDPNLLLFLNLDACIVDKGVVGSGHLLQSVHQVGLQPAAVVIEIIESKVCDIDSLKLFVKTHKAHGFLIALDDIGNGCSNLDRILHVRPDIIKIDRGIISDIDRDYYKQELFRALAKLAKKIGTLVVAEGVETRAEALTSLECGADMLQGYFFARPEPDVDSGSAAVRQKTIQVASDYRAARIQSIDSVATCHRKYERLMEETAAELAVIAPAEFTEKLTELAAKNSKIQYYYLLNMDGIQITDTIGEHHSDKPRQSLFQADFKGADQSVKEYYIFIKSGADRYITEPYISLANGVFCVTASLVFRHMDQSSYILCIDFTPESGLCLAGYGNAAF